MSAHSLKLWPTSVLHYVGAGNLTANRDHDLMYQRFPSAFAPDDAV